MGQNKAEGCGGVMFFSKEKRIQTWTKKKNVAKLAKELQDPKSEMRFAVIKSLVEVGDSNAVSALMTSIKDPDPKIRIEILDALGKIGNDRAKEDVRFLSDKDENADVKKKALEILAMLNKK